MSDFQIGQIFENEYPPAVASFCSKNNAKIEVVGTADKTVQRSSSGHTTSKSTPWVKRST